MSELERLRSAAETAAHELRTPATVLVGLANTLSRNRASLDQTRLDELLDAIVRQTQVLDRVTADLLASSEADHGGPTAEIEVMALAPALHAAALSVAELTQVAVSCPAALSVRADPVRVQQMLTNLLTNATKYGAPPISLTASAVDGQAVVRVDDSGPGVPEAFRSRLFERYSRAGGSRAAGTGLGLFVVRALARAQGGDAWYEPRPEVGSSFSLSLPLG
jgi:signal transduction histidine kinase